MAHKLVVLNKLLAYMWRSRELHLPPCRPSCHSSITCIKWIMELSKIIVCAQVFCEALLGKKEILSDGFTFQLKTTEGQSFWEHKPVWSIPAPPPPPPHRHRALFSEIGIIKFTFELSSLSSACGITHNDIQSSPDHIYDSIFDTAVHQQRITQPKRIALPFLSLNTIHFPV